MQEQVQFSVVIPTLNNREVFLLEALNSVKIQTLAPKEVILVNNGRGEVNTKLFDLPVKVINTVYRAGAAQARNVGVTLSICEYVAFLDDDDLWEATHLEKASERIVIDKPSCLIAKIHTFNAGISVEYKNAAAKLDKDVLLVRNPGTGDSSLVVKKSDFLEIGGCDTKLVTGYDKALVLEFILRGFSVVTEPNCKVFFRQHNQGLRLTDSTSMAEGTRAFYTKYKSIMNLEQRAFNLSKIHNYLWLSKMNITNFFVSRFFLGICSFLKFFR